MSSALQISVIICTRNPREDYLRRTLEALKTQTLPTEQWELLLIDNASKEPVAEKWDLSWHPQARHVQEEELGLTPARLRGIRESRGELLVFVDDDNLLSQTYLETVLRIIYEMPFIEVVGCGSIIGEFEEPPQAWAEPYLPSLALRQIERDLWSNDPLRLGFYPCGAGLCITKKVSQAYKNLLESDPWRKKLDRSGTSLFSGGDCDICFTAGSMGLGVGMFKGLELCHLIPKERLAETYLLRLSEGISYSGCILEYLWKGKVPPKHSLRWHLKYWRMVRGMNPIQRRFADTWARAEIRAQETIRLMQTSAIPKDNHEK